MWLPAWPEIVVTCSSVAVAGSQQVLQKFGCGSAVEDEGAQEERNGDDGRSKNKEEMVCAAICSRGQKKKPDRSIVGPKSRGCM